MQRSALTAATLLAALTLLCACSSGSQSSGGTNSTGANPAASAAPQSAAGPGGGASDTGGAPGGGQGRGGRGMGKILQGLGLSDAQKSQIRAIMADVKKKNAGLDRTDPASRATMRANMQAGYAQIDAVLTPAQRDQFHAKLKAMRAKYQKNQPQPQSSS